MNLYNFSENDAPLLIVLGQSNAHGHGTRVSEEEKKEYPLQHVYGLSRKHNQSYELEDVVWEPFDLAGMNLGEEQDDTCCLAGEFSMLWEKEIKSGKILPPLYVIQISIGCQGIDRQEREGCNMWFPDREKRLFPGQLGEVDISLYPLAQRVLRLSIQNIKKSGKNPVILGLHWNQWETEVDSGSEVLSRAPENYRRLLDGFYDALEERCRTYLYYPHSRVYENEAGRRYLLTVFEQIQAERDDVRIIDISRSNLWMEEREDKGIFQEDLVHYSNAAHKWFAKYQFWQIFGKKVLVIGDSITADGRFLTWVEKYMQLKEGDTLYHFMNCGLCSENISGLTERNHPGQRPCVLDRIDEVLRRHEADMVIVSYGMNDGIYHPFREEYFAAFQKGYRVLMDRLKKSGMEICLMTPASFEPLDFQGELMEEGAEDYSYISPYKDYDEVLERYSRWIVNEWEDKVQVLVDLHTVMKQEHEAQRKKQSGYLSGDGIHPGEHGHFMIGASLVQALYGVCLSAFEHMDGKNCMKTEWQGFEAEHFFFRGFEAVVVMPEKPAAGNPWIYRTEFFGEFPAVDLAMLEKGYAVANFRICNQYGAPSAVSLMGAFCRLVSENYRLSEKTILFGFSRGGLYALHFAAAFPEKVEKIYFDAPVVDLYSWPKKEKDGMSVEWKECRQIWHLDIGPPFFGEIIHKALALLIKHRIPVVIVYGEEDELVPYGENGRLIEEAFQQSQIPFLLIGKKGAGHHPHSLDQPDRIADFLTGRQ